MAAAFSLGCAGPVSAARPGILSGRVVDQTGVALSGVTVELRRSDRLIGTQLTSLDGAYRFDRVPAGPALLSFRLINFVKVERRVVVVTGEQPQTEVTMFVSLAADISVTGRRTFRNVTELDPVPEDLVGVAGSASQGVVSARQLETRPVLRSGDVLETVPGLITSQHSGEGKSNQYYLRGFNLDHGTDFATTVAGIPVNMPTHAHGHGYTDLNFLIPELVSGVQFRKGPYFAQDGDFAAAGSSHINYVNELPSPVVKFGAGQDGWGRVFTAASPRIGQSVVLAALELNRNDGPWVRPDAYRRVNGVLRYSRGDARNGLSVTAMGHSARWDATDQVPVRAVASGLISRFQGLDRTLGGDTSRYAVSADAQRSNGPGVTRVAGFVQRYSLDLFSNFTYFLVDPVNGDQFEQTDRRWVSGGRISHRRLMTWGGASGGGLRRCAAASRFDPSWPISDPGAPPPVHHPAGHGRADIGRRVRGCGYRVVTTDTHGGGAAGRCVLVRCDR